MAKKATVSQEEFDKTVDFLMKKIGEIQVKIEALAKAQGLELRLSGADDGKSPA